MATKVKVTQQPVEELEQKYGVKAKDGTLDYAEGKYFLVVGRKRTELDPRHLVAPEPIVRLFETKATVKVIAAKDGIMVIVWNGKLKFVPILCYKPINVLAKRLDLEVANLILSKALEEKRITPEFHAYTTATMTPKSAS